MTAQEIFDKVTTHLLTQNRQSRKDIFNTGYESCAYRGDDGLMCAVGVLIPDELYDPRFEGLCPPLNYSDVCAPDLDRRFWFVDVLKQIGIAEQDLGLLADLQSIHDSHTPAEWPSQLELLAGAKRLSLPDALVQALNKGNS